MLVLLLWAPAQEARRRQQEGDSDGSRPASRAGDPARPESRAGAAPTPPASLPREEVVRRLRALGEPVTLFGEGDDQRFERMLLAEQNMQVCRAWGDGVCTPGSAAPAFASRGHLPRAAEHPRPWLPPSVGLQVEDEMRGGGELENLHARFKREAVAARKAAAEAALASTKGGRAGKAGDAGKAGEAGKGKDAGGDKAGGEGGDQQQQDGGDQQALAELDPEQQVRGWLAASGGGMPGLEAAASGCMLTAKACCAASLPLRSSQRGLGSHALTPSEQQEPRLPCGLPLGPAAAPAGCFCGGGRGVEREVDAG